MKAYTDGACRISNPGLCSCAWVLYDKDQVVAEKAYYLGHGFHSNNYAEYMGLEHLLEFLYLMEIKNVTICSDSKLVVNQVNQNWKINDETLRKMANMSYGLLVQGGHILVHIKGHDGELGNERADLLCNQELDKNMEAYENYNASRN